MNVNWSKSTLHKCCPVRPLQQTFFLAEELKGGYKKNEKRKKQQQQTQKKKRESKQKGGGEKNKADGGPLKLPKEIAQIGRSSERKSPRPYATHAKFLYYVL